MSNTSIERLLRETTGLDAAALGTGAVERAVKSRARATGTADVAAYVRLVHSNAEELQELIEAVVVPETWFFRGAEALTALAALAQARIEQGSDAPIRVLSLPCATGEEPYSIAIALLEAGIPLERFCIDAVDISARALDAARAGCYGPNSFRGSDPVSCARFFVDSGNRRQVSAVLRSHVQFHRGNLLDSRFPLAGSRAYDFIFCRNLLIYFDGENQERAVAALRRLLLAQGVLFVGSSEAGLLLQRGFHSARLPMAFAFYHPEFVPAKPTARVQPVRQKRRAAPPRVARRAPAVRASGLESTPTSSPTRELDAAAQLADQGRLDEAVQLCMEHLRDNPASAPAFYLLAVIEDARGKPDAAAELYRKALYVDPSHAAALTHLAYVLERRGERSAADALRQRLQRRRDMQT